MISAVAAGTLVLAGVAWLWTELEVIQSDYGIYVRAGIAVSVIAVFGGVLWRVFNRPRVVDFMIATESEMRKVNWPTRNEVIGSTWIVICGTMMMALLLFIVDILFAVLFQGIGVLEKAG